MTDIEIEARKLVRKLLQASLPESKRTLTLLDEFPLTLPYTSIIRGREIGVISEDTIKFLIGKDVLVLHKTLESSNEYPQRPTKFIVSYKQKPAEDFLHIITHGDFSWDKRDGLWSYKNESHSFRLGTGQYRLINMFMESPSQHFSEEEIINTYSPNRDAVIKRVANDLIKEIKKPLGIPQEHFISGDGYTFKPLL